MRRRGIGDMVQGWKSGGARRELRNEVAARAREIGDGYALYVLVGMLCVLVRSTGAAIPDYGVAQRCGVGQETVSGSGDHGRHQLLDISNEKHFVPYILAADSPAFTPSPGIVAPVPAPVPALFPSDPPLTVPFLAPSPGPLTIPIPDRPLTPKLSGNCSFNFTSVSVAATFQRTAFDCAAPLAAYVGVVICCPQFDSLLRIMQGQHMLTTGALALNETEAQYCFDDTINFLISLLANSSVPSLCNVKPSNLTGDSCPVTTTREFELLVNTTSLLEACEVVDPFKECTTQTCQTQIADASFRLAQGLSETLPSQTTVDECESLTLSWLASRLSTEEANSVLRTVMSCGVNRICPLVFSNSTAVSRSCQGSTPSKVTCCGSLAEYLLAVQKQMLVTNQQAYRCAATLSTMLQSQGVTADLYSLCDIDLRDFSLQAQGTEGCLLQSQPTDVNATSSDIILICDLNDNIGAQWSKPAASNISSPTPSALPPSSSPPLNIATRMVMAICALSISTLFTMSS